MLPVCEFDGRVHISYFINGQCVVRRKVEGVCSRERPSGRAAVLMNAAQPTSRLKKRDQARLTINAAARELVATTKIAAAASRDPVSILVAFSVVHRQIKLFWGVRE